MVEPLFARSNGVRRPRRESRPPGGFFLGTLLGMNKSVGGVASPVTAMDAS
jgi:hypothetical protein